MPTALVEWPIIQQSECITIYRTDGLKKKLLHDYSHYQIGKAKYQILGLFLERLFIIIRCVSLR